MNVDIAATRRRGCGAPRGALGVEAPRRRAAFATGEAAWRGLARLGEARLRAHTHPIAVGDRRRCHGFAAAAREVRLRTVRRCSARRGAAACGEVRRREAAAKCVCVSTRAGAGGG